MNVDVATGEVTITKSEVTWSEQVDKIAPALHKAHGEIAPLVKDSKNDHFNNTYASLEATIDAVEPALHANGIFVLQPPVSSTNGKYEVGVETWLMHISGQYVRSRLMLQPSKQDPQGAGSAITYARRYALQGVCGIAAEDDDGNDASKQGKASKASRGNTERPATEPIAADQPHVYRLACKCTRCDGITNIHKLKAERMISDPAYREAMVAIFGTEIWKARGVSGPTTTVLDAGELRKLYAHLRSQHKAVTS